MTTPNSDDTAGGVGLQRMVRARFGAPSEDDGNCEMCNASGPTWLVEEPVTWNQYPLCAKCITEATRPNAEWSDGGRKS